MASKVSFGGKTISELVETKRDLVFTNSDIDFRTSQEGRRQTVSVLHFSASLHHSSHAFVIETIIKKSKVLFVNPK